MVSCVVSFLLVFHADVCSEHYEPLFVHAGVSGCFIPSIFRFALMYVEMRPSIGFIDFTVLLIMTVHLTAACVVVVLITVESAAVEAPFKIHLIVAAASILLSTLICLLELLGLVMLATKHLHRRVLAWPLDALSEENKDPNTAAP